MKTICSLVLFAGVCLVFVGCESDVPPGPKTSNQLERGLTGQGTVYQPDRSNDPMIREQSRVGY